MIQFDDGGLEGLGCAGCGPPSLTEQFQVEGLGAASTDMDKGCADMKARCVADGGTFTFDSPGNCGCGSGPAVVPRSGLVPATPAWSDVGAVVKTYGWDRLAAADVKQIQTMMGLPPTGKFDAATLAVVLVTVAMGRMDPTKIPAASADLYRRVVATVSPSLTPQQLLVLAGQAGALINDANIKSGLMMMLDFAQEGLKQAGVTAPPATPAPPAPVPAAGTLPAPSTTAVAASSSWEWVKAHKTSVGVGVAAAALAYLVLRPSGRGQGRAGR